MSRRFDQRRYTNNSGEVHITMEDNVIRTTTETPEVGMADKDSGEDSNRRSCWRKCKTTGMYTEAKEMWDGNI